MIRHRFSRLLPQFARRPVQGRVAGWALACAAALCAAGAVLPPPALAQSSATQLLERRVKAAFLYKFLSYAEFPAGAFSDSTAPVTIGVIGSDEMAAELARVVAGRQALGRPIQVRSLREGESGPPVHLLFVAGSDNARAARILRAAPSALMSVTECEFGLQYGSVINFRIIEDRVRFDVSVDSAEKNNVKLSSRLLTVANHVVKGTS
ncbi:YfiR family protein [Massilia sp. GCM10023247]|uniref:YfiR family protein n=1 Tax=Massilia sp. GCM10023247 TaxID=3252643 RepID=UPI00361DAEFB